MNGSCATIRSCQRWASGPSSACGVTPTVATWTTTSNSAIEDMAKGRKPLGLRKRVATLIDVRSL